VLYLAKQLPQNPSFFALNIYMGNFFSCVTLFDELRRLGIGACGTVRVNSAYYFPKQLKTVDAKEWNSVDSIICLDVLAVRWVDNSNVYLLSTIHTVHKEDDWVLK